MTLSLMLSGSTECNGLDMCQEYLQEHSTATKMVLEIVNQKLSIKEMDKQPGTGHQKDTAESLRSSKSNKR